MALTNFYLIAGGTGSADINAGSTIGAATVGATTNGNWNSATGVFISTGTPFGPVQVGDYASVYVDGATVTTFVGKVTTVTSTAQITVDVATIKYGTAPSTSATARSCVIGGSWNTEQVLSAGGLATFTVPQSTKINLKGNLTITASRTISMAGTVANALWFSFYNTTPGDLDNDTTNTLAKPVWTMNSAVVLTCSGVRALWSGLSVSGSVSGSQWVLSGNNIRLSRCRSANASANAAAVALSSTAAFGVVASYCYFTTPSTATTTGVVSVTGGPSVFLGCLFDTGGLAGLNATTEVNCYDSVFLNNTGSGIQIGTGTILRVIGCTFYSPTINGIKINTTLTGLSTVTGCLFVSTTNGINNAATANDLLTRSCNDYYSVTNPEVGMGDLPALFAQTESGNPVTSSTNMTPIVGANARANGFPGIFENQSYSSYPNIGAVMQAVIPPAPGGGVSQVFGG